MALEGQLSDFNLAEILQLIATQQKSGFLKLEANREMVFIFDRGVLISTRDRRSHSRDPLEAYMQAYGFFNERQWKHIEFVRQNSNLDLTEILISEGLLKEDELNRALKGVAQEMAHKGMKLRRGRYHFNPTKGSPPGIRGQFRLDVQGLIMEAARRLDEERILLEALPSSSITFTAGDISPDPDQMLETGRRIMELALAGLNLGQIIRQGKTESFVVRDLLKSWCGEGYLLPSQAGDQEEDPGTPKKTRGKIRLGPKVRSIPLTMFLVVMLGAIGWLRWSVPEPAGPYPGEDLRKFQIRTEVISAARLYLHENGGWPSTLAELVRDGQLPASTLTTVEDMGWKYTLNSNKKSFNLGA